MIRRPDGSFDFRANDMAEQARRNASWDSIGGWWVRFGILAVGLALIVEAAPPLSTAALKVMGFISQRECANNYHIRTNGLEHLCGDGSDSAEAPSKGQVTGGS